MKQQEMAALRFVEAYTDDHGHAPTFREIQEGLGWSSVSVAFRWIGFLVDRGLVAPCAKCSAAANRTLHLTDYGRRVLDEMRVA